MLKGRVEYFWQRSYVPQNLKFLPIVSLQEICVDSFLSVARKKLGFFHEVKGREYRGLTHRRIWGTVAKFIVVKTKNWPQVPDVSSIKRWLSSIFLQKKVHTLGLQAHTHAHQALEARTGSCNTSLCLISPSAFLPPRLRAPNTWGWAVLHFRPHSCHTQARTAAKERKHTRGLR